MSERIVKLSGLKKAMARQMRKSWEQVPQFQLETEVDCTRLIELREKLAYRPSYTVMIAKACAHALYMHPEINASFAEDHILEKEEINIGIAVDTKRGLLVPVLKEVSKKDLEQLHLEFNHIIKGKAASGAYSLEELSGGTFTISNLGMYRIHAFSSIVNAPESAILSVPRMCEKLVLNEGGGVEKKMMLRLVLSLDHRVIDGAAGSRFLMELIRQMEEPERLLQAAANKKSADA